MDGIKRNLRVGEPDETPHGAAIGIVEKHRREIERSPGVGADVQAYAIAVCEDILNDLRPSGVREGQPQSERCAEHPDADHEVQCMECLKLSESDLVGTFDTTDLGLAKYHDYECPVFSAYARRLYGEKDASSNECICGLSDVVARIAGVREGVGASPQVEDRYYALRDAVAMYAGDGISSDDAVINEAQEHAKIAQCCICPVSDDRTERGAPQLRTVPFLSLQRLEWVYPYGSEEPYVRISDLDKISRPALAAVRDGIVSTPQHEK